MVPSLSTTLTSNPSSLTRRCSSSVSPLNAARSSGSFGSLMLPLAVLVLRLVVGSSASKTTIQNTEIQAAHAFNQPAWRLLASRVAPTAGVPMAAEQHCRGKECLWPMQQRFQGQRGQRVGQRRAWLGRRTLGAVGVDIDGPMALECQPGIQLSVVLPVCMCATACNQNS